MFTIKRAVELTGIAAGTLRAWEQRYGIGTPARTESGYRVYDQRAIDEILAMQKLVESGWTHHEAAKEVLRPRAPRDAAIFQANTAAFPELSSEFLEAARALDVERLGAALDRAFSSGSYEFVIDSWLIPTLRLLGDEWTAGRMDIASEHFASNAIMRRLSSAFESSAVGQTNTKVLVGTPAGSFHEIGALALAVALRRRGVGVVYLGINIPAEAWVTAVNQHKATGAVISAVMKVDVIPAQKIVDELNRSCKGVKIVVGGANARSIHNATLVSDGGIGDAAKTISDSLKK